MKNREVFAEAGFCVDTAFGKQFVLGAFPNME